MISVISVLLPYVYIKTAPRKEMLECPSRALVFDVGYLGHVVDLP